MAPAPLDPLTVPCPRCDAGIAEPCERPDGRELDKPHADRRKLAEHVLEQARQRADGDAAHRIGTKRFRRLYAAARLELEQRSDWTLLAAEQLESLALNMEAAEAARLIAKAKPAVPGSMGQDVANPMTAVALRYDAQALATARALKLTPDTRGASAPPGADDVPDEDDSGDEPRDELADLDDLARQRKRRARTTGAGRGSRRARG